MSGKSLSSNNIGGIGGLYHWLFQDTMEGLRRRRALLGYLFLLPTLLGIFIFTAGPIFVSFGLSLYRWNIFKPPDFIALDNFERLLADRRVIVGLGNTLKFTVLAVASQVSLGLILALAVHRINRIWLRYYFRTAYFLPLLMSGASVAVFMGYIFHKEFGPLNYYLTLLGLPQIPWLTNSDLVMISIAIISAWRNLGFTFLIFLGGLANLSQEVLDAADVDGAQGLRRLWSVVIPLLSPQILFATVTGVIGALQVFDEPYIMTRGGPGNASRTLVMVMYEHAFKDIEFGYGSAIAIVVFLMILAMSAVQMWLWRNRVFYQ
ncbi:MAG: sugar ABC transporter permease [Chloroflexota bacterium]|nr:sugar ABC transporter permease [Chloroflexota bacterium]MDE2952480.1 sugar ABC transporter permease [Chloroflexota bacterium]